MSIARNLCHSFKTYIDDVHGNKDNILLNPEFDFEKAIGIIEMLAKDPVKDTKGNKYLYYFDDGTGIMVKDKTMYCLDSNNNELKVSIE